jgi:hypothetical protein
MGAELIVAPEAEEFLSSVDACLELVRRRPEMYQFTKTTVAL